MISMDYQYCKQAYMIDQYMDERVIAEAFSMMGEHVLSVKLLKDHKTGQGRNFCFVQLTSQEAVTLALKRLTGLPLPNYPAKRFKLNYSLRELNQSQSVGAHGGSSYGSEFSVYVGGLNFNTTDEELKGVFSHYKSFKEAKIVRDESMRSKGFGFVRFFELSDQEAAIQQMNGAVGPLGVTLRVDRAMPKRELMMSQGMGHGGPSHMSTGSAVAALSASYHNPQYPPYQGGMDPYAQPPQMHPAGAQQHAPQPYQTEVPQAAGASKPAAAPTTQRAPQPPAKQEDDDETLEDHSAPVNMVATNLAFIQANQEFYRQLDQSRWHPITSYSTTMAEISQ